MWAAQQRAAMLGCTSQMYGFNAYRLEILPLIQKNNRRKEFRLEAGQLPDQFLKSQTGEENTTFVFRLLCLDVFSFYLLCRPADVLWLHSFCAAIPPCKHTLTACRFFCEYFTRENVSNDNDLAAKAVEKSADFVSWDVCTYCVLGLVCMDSCQLSYRFRQDINTHSKSPILFTVTPP